MRFFRSALMGSIFLFMSGHAIAQSDIKKYYLNDVLKQVQQQHPVLMAARERVKERMELYPQARAGWLPSVNAQTSVFSSSIKNSNFNQADGAVTKDFTASVDQPIWRGGRTFAETDRAQDIIEGEKAIYLQIEQDLFLDTVRGYINVLRDRELLILFKQNEDLLLEELKGVRERHDIGDKTITDVQQVELRVLRSKSARMQASNNLDISHSAFEAISKMAPPPYMVAPQPRFYEEQTLEELITMAKAHHPSLINADYRYQASAHQVDAVSRELLPQVSAFASYNIQKDPQPGIVDSTQNETVGVRATLALYEGGAIRSRKREAKHASKRQAYEIDDVVIDVVQDVRANWYSYNTYKSLVQNRNDEVRLAEQALNGVREEAKMGQRSILNILDADEELIEAQTSLVRAKYDHILAHYILANSIGMMGLDL